MEGGEEEMEPLMSFCKEEDVLINQLKKKVKCLMSYSECLKRHPPPYKDITSLSQKTSESLSPPPAKYQARQPRRFEEPSSRYRSVWCEWQWKEERRRYGL